MADPVFDSTTQRLTKPSNPKMTKWFKRLKARERRAKDYPIPPYVDHFDTTPDGNLLDLMRRGGDKPPKLEPNPLPVVKPGGGGGGGGGGGRRRGRSARATRARRGAKR